MKSAVTVPIAVVTALLIICGTVALVNFINRDRVHVPTKEDVFAIECAKRGGNPNIRTGWENEVHIDEYKCEGVK